MNHRLRAVVICACVAFLAACKSTVLPDYEVLELPRPATQFAPGSKWKEGQGPIAPPSAQVTVTTSDGVEQLKIQDKDQFKLDLKVPIIKWISGNAGLEDKDVVDVDFADLQHTVVQDARPVDTVGTVLWEVVTAGTIKIELTKAARASVDLAADPVKAKLASAVTGSGPVTLDVQIANNDRTYQVHSSRRLVVAIRVVDLERDVRGGRTPLNLTTQVLGVGSQPAELGYEVVPESPVDFLKKEATLRIRNPTFPGWTGDRFNSSPQTDTWVNPKREVIAASDKRAKDADFVWDTMNIVWSHDLDKCELETVRQYVELKPAKSGLEGIR